MATNALKTKSTTVKIGQGDAASVAAGSDTFDTIGEVKNFQGPGGTADIIDATHFGSTAKEKIMGLPDNGQVTFGVNYVPGDIGQDAAAAARNSQTLKNIRVTFSNGTIWDFKAYVMGINPSGAVNSIVDATITVEISGSWTIT